MNLAQGLTAELEHEAKSTRKMLERLPEDKYDWQPHDKSMPATRLASHIAELPGWAATILDQEDFDLAAADYQPVMAKTRDELLELFDRNLQGFNDALENRSDEQMLRHWVFRSGDHVIVDLPKVAAIRGFILSHILHHRGQLSVYLRLLDVPVPSTFGPTADESGMP